MEGKMVAQVRAHGLDTDILYLLLISHPKDKLFWSFCVTGVEPFDGTCVIHDA